jgi:hypothetical protein
VVFLLWLPGFLPIRKNKIPKRKDISVCHLMQMAVRFEDVPASVLDDKKIEPGEEKALPTSVKEDDGIEKQ